MLLNEGRPLACLSHDSNYLHFQKGQTRDTERWVVLEGGTNRQSMGPFRAVKPPERHNNGAHMPSHVSLKPQFPRVNSNGSRSFAASAAHCGPVAGDNAPIVRCVV